MGLYPYMYSSDSGRWTYSAETVIWHIDILDSSWNSIGTQPSRWAPESLAGLGITISLPMGFQASGIFYGNNQAQFTDDNGETWNNYVYHYEYSGENKAVLSLKDTEPDLDESSTLVLVMTSTVEGTYTGVLLDFDTVSAIAGTFGLFSP